MGETGLRPLLPALLVSWGLSGILVWAGPWCFNWLTELAVKSSLSDAISSSVLLLFHDQPNRIDSQAAWPDRDPSLPASPSPPATLNWGDSDKNYFSDAFSLHLFFYWSRLERESHFMYDVALTWLSTVFEGITAKRVYITQKACQQGLGQDDKAVMLWEKICSPRGVTSWPCKVWTALEGV